MNNLKMLALVAAAIIVAAIILWVILDRTGYKMPKRRSRSHRNVLPDRFPPEKRLLACDRCGKFVSKSNDAYRFVCILLGKDPEKTHQSRHLLPNGKCIGSPSNAQYLPGQPKDSRPNAIYHPEREVEYRRVYEQLKKRYPDD